MSGEFSVNTELVFSFFLVRFTVAFLGNSTRIDKKIRYRPNKTVKVVFQNKGIPRKGKRTSIRPTKNVLVLTIILDIIHANTNFQKCGEIEKGGVFLF